MTGTVSRIDFHLDLVDAWYAVDSVGRLFDQFDECSSRPCKRGRIKSKYVRRFVVVEDRANLSLSKHGSRTGDAEADVELSTGGRVLMDDARLIRARIHVYDFVETAVVCWIRQGGKANVSTNVVIGVRISKRFDNRLRRIEFWRLAQRTWGRVVA